MIAFFMGDFYLGDRTALRSKSLLIMGLLRARVRSRYHF
jgi:hypothetical protein